MDFAQLVAKMNEIDSGKTAPTKKASANNQTVHEDPNTQAMADILHKIHNQGTTVSENRMGFKDLEKLGKDNASKVDQEARRQGSADMEPGDADELRYKVAKKMGLVETLKKVEEAKKVAEEEATETMQDRFAKFLKSEREAGTAVEEMKQGLEEASAEYEYADRAFSKMSETINTLEKMCREGGMLEQKIIQAGGDATALSDMREALSSAYEACEASHYHAMGSGDSRSGE